MTNSVPTVSNIKESVALIKKSLLKEEDTKLFQCGLKLYLITQLAALKMSTISL